MPTDRERATKEALRLPDPQLVARRRWFRAMLNPSKAGSPSQPSNHHRPTSQLQQACLKYAEGSSARGQIGETASGQVHGVPVLWAGMLECWAGN
ncbi:uncharacterized protein TrAtP1_003505 [Trichoderma atroviride]|uniref:uncharacterized protein n=1 Tax=Hypocrea atroviridis TaxID=63577 RepID=UPI00332DF31F|nr:hypothetical protein TrAtP1_003505 [Trichoderma atroviride]